MPDQDVQEIILRGISGSPGICIGKAYIVDKEGVEVVPKYAIDPRSLENEKKRFKKAVKKAADELHKIIADIPVELRHTAHILETQVVLLKDKMLLGSVFLLHAQKALAEGDIRQAEDFLKDSAEIAAKTGSPDLLYRVAWHTGRLDQQKGMSGQAKEEEARALGIVEDFKQKRPEEYRADFIEAKLKTI